MSNIHKLIISQEIEWQFLFSPSQDSKLWCQKFHRKDVFLEVKEERKDRGGSQLKYQGKRISSTSKAVIFSKDTEGRKRNGRKEKGLCIKSKEYEPNTESDEEGHERDSQGITGHQGNFNSLSLLLEVLSNHYNWRLTNHGDADSNEDSKSEEQLMKLSSKGCKEASESSHQSSQDCHESWALSTADSDDEGWSKESHGCTKTGGENCVIQKDKTDK